VSPPSPEVALSSGSSTGTSREVPPVKATVRRAWLLSAKTIWKGRLGSAGTSSRPELASVHFCAMAVMSNSTALPPSAGLPTAPASAHPSPRWARPGTARRRRRRSLGARQAGLDERRVRGALGAPLLRAEREDDRRLLDGGAGGELEQVPQQGRLLVDLAGRRDRDGQVVLGDAVEALCLVRALLPADRRAFADDARIGPEVVGADGRRLGERGGLRRGCPQRDREADRGCDGEGSRCPAHGRPPEAG
jgi:hypothetical protein